MWWRWKEGRVWYQWRMRQKMLMRERNNRRDGTDRRWADDVGEGMRDQRTRMRVLKAGRYHLFVLLYENFSHNHDWIQNSGSLETLHDLVETRALSFYERNLPSSCSLHFVPTRVNESHGDDRESQSYPPLSLALFRATTSPNLALHPNSPHPSAYLCFYLTTSLLASLPFSNHFVSLAFDLVEEIRGWGRDFEID